MLRLFVIALVSSSHLLSIAAAYDTARDVPPVIQSIGSDLIFDAHNRLANLAVVFDNSNPQCHDLVKTSLQKHLEKTPRQAERIQLAAIEGEAFDRVLAPYKSEKSGCMAACIERGTDRDLAGHVMPNEVYNSAEWDTADGSMSQWFTEICAKKEVCLMNYHSREHPMVVYWKQEGGGDWNIEAGKHNQGDGCN